MNKVTESGTRWDGWAVTKVIRSQVSDPAVYLEASSFLDRHYESVSLTISFLLFKVPRVPDSPCLTGARYSAPPGRRTQYREKPGDRERM